MSTPTYYSTWELIDYKVQYELRKKTFLLRGYAQQLGIWTQARPVLLKTYEATIQDVDPAVAELPCPSYVAGTSIINANPENLSPVGWETGQWHLISMDYTKSLSDPMTRHVKVTWEQKGNWVTIEDESDSQ